MRLRERDDQVASVRLSRLSAAALLALFLSGITVGAVKYAQRSPLVARHDAGSNAITIHVILAVAAAVTVAGVQVRQARHFAERGRSPWAAPFSASAVQRLGRTMRFAGGLSAPNVARFIATVPLVLVLAYEPFRMGVQLTGGLDPNATVNAWGGPTYAGALLAHWLDSLAGFYAAAFLLSRLMLPPGVGNR